MINIKKIIALFLCFWLVASPMAAQVLPDGTTITAVLKSAENNTPVVNIAAPSDKGVSHNRFKEYNVGPDNLIINNSKENGILTKLGGYVLGNPYLMQAGREAQIILNEVSGILPTNLNGYTEVAGKKAQLIIANPNGITASGAGFINTSKLTLVTGRSNIINGDLQSFSLDNTGKITVNAQASAVHDSLGIDAQDADSINLVSRFMNIDGTIFGQDLNLLAGSDRYYYEDNRITSKNVNTLLDREFAIDAGLLGAMRAGTINIIATERGFGVNTQGPLVADLSTITINSQGDIRLKEAKAQGSVLLNAANNADIGEVYSKADIGLTATNSAQYDTLKAADNINIKAAEVKHKNIAQAGKNIDIEAGSFTIDVPQTSDSGVISYGDINIKADNLNNNDEIAAYQNIVLTAQNINNTGLILAQDTLTANAAAALTNNGSIYGGLALALNSDGIITNSGSIYGNGDIIIKGLTGLRAAQIINNGGLIQASKGSITIDAQNIKNLSIDNCDPSKEVCFTTEWVETGLFPPMGGNVIARYQIAIPTLQAVQSGRVTAAKDITLNAGDILNNSSIISAAENIVINADNITNTRTSFEVKLLNYIWRRYKVRVAMGTKYSTRNSYWYEEFKSLVRSLTPAVIKAASVTINATGRLMVDAAEDGQTDIAWSSSPSNGLLDAAEQSGIFDPISLTDFGAGGMFKKDDPDSSYLFVTNNRFLNAQDFIGADYFASLMGISGGQKHANGDGRFDYQGSGYNIAGLDNDKNTVKWLGDAIYEQQLIQASILKLTGNTYLFNDMPDMNTQMTRLYDNALTAYQSYGLEFGRALTEDQIASLKEPIIWYVEKEYDGQSVYGPVLYLPKGYIDSYADSPYSRIEGDKLIVNIKDLKNSGLIAGTEALIAAQDNISNVSGTITAKNNLDISAGGDIENTTKLNSWEAGHKGSNYYMKESWLGDTATIASGGNLTMAAGGDISSRAGIISAQNDAALSADNINIMGQVLESVSNSHTRKNTVNRTSSSNVGSSVLVGGNLTMTANGDILSRASSIMAEKDISITADNVNIIEQSLENSSYSKSHGKTTEEKSITNIGSYLGAGGNLSINAADDILVRGSGLQADNNIDLTGANVTISSVEDTYHFFQESKSGNSITGKRKRTKAIDSVTQVGSEVMAGGKLSINTTDDVTLLASSLGGDKGGIEVNAGKNINILAAEDFYATLDKVEKSSLGGLIASKDMTYDSVTTQSKSVVFSGENLKMTSGADTTVYASDISALGSGEITTGGNLNIIAGLDKTYHYEEHYSRSFDILDTLVDITKDLFKMAMPTDLLTGVLLKEAFDTGKVEVFSADFGSIDESVYEKYNETVVQSNLVFGGGLDIKSNKDVNLVSSNIISDSLNISADNVNIMDMNTNSFENRSEKHSALTLSGGVNVPFYNLLAQGKDVVNSGERVSDDVKAAYDGNSRDTEQSYISGGANFLNLVNSLSEVGGILKDIYKKGPSDIASQSAILYGRIDADVSESNSTIKEGVSVGSVINTNADININANQDITQKGSLVVSNNGDISYNAGNDINILAGQNTYFSETYTDNYHASAQFNINPFMPSIWNLNLGYSQQSNSDIYYALTHSNSGLFAQNGNISITSGNDTIVKGGNIGAETIDISAQNLFTESLQDTTYNSSRSESFSGNLTIGSTGFGAGANYSHGKTDGSSAWVNNQTSIVSTGAMDIDVKDTTTLIGSVIGSESGQLSLNTGALEYKDIHDYSDTDTIKYGFGANLGGQAPGEINPDSVSGQLSINGHEKEQITKATIGEGDITINGSTATDEQLEGLNRDLENTQEVTRDEDTGGLDADLTLSTKWFTEEGRKEILDNFFALQDILIETGGIVTKEIIAGIEKIPGGIGTFFMGIIETEKAIFVAEMKGKFDEIEKEKIININAELAKEGKTWETMSKKEQEAYKNKKNIKYVELYNEYVNLMERASQGIENGKNDYVFVNGKPVYIMDRINQIAPEMIAMHATMLLTESAKKNIINGAVKQINALYENDDIINKLNNYSTYTKEEKEKLANDIMKQIKADVTVVETSLKNNIYGSYNYSNINIDFNNKKNTSAERFIQTLFHEQYHFIIDNSNFSKMGTEGKVIKINNNSNAMPGVISSPNRGTYTPSSKSKSGYFYNPSEGAAKLFGEQAALYFLRRRG